MNSADGYERIRSRLLDLCGEGLSRRQLSEKLRISTHTIQSIITGKDLPDLSSSNVSLRRKLAWVRTVTRIAHALKEDPWELLGPLGVSDRTQVVRSVESELEKLESEDARPPAQTPADLLARGLLMSLPVSDRRSRTLETALSEYLDRVRQPGRASSQQLFEGRFCRSCMAALEQEGESIGSHRYCRWCSDGEGNLLPRDEVLGIMTEWFRSWQPGLSSREAERRADLYMRSMPAWADEDE